LRGQLYRGMKKLLVSDTHFVSGSGASEVNPNPRSVPQT
jgi:hypothetical protein